MSLWRQLARGLRALTHRLRRPTASVDDEVRALLRATHARTWSREGLSPDEARAPRGASSATWPQRRRSSCAPTAGRTSVETTLADLRYAARRLRQSRQASRSIAVLTLALGIGASTAIFSAVDPILFEPLPYPDASRVVIADRSRRRRRAARRHVRRRTSRLRRAAARSTRLAVASAGSRRSPAAASPERLHRRSCQRGLLPACSASRRRSGGISTPRIDDHGGPRVAIVSDGLAERRFGGARAVLGRQITLDDADYTVIGVMPAGFENVLAPGGRSVGAAAVSVRKRRSSRREWGHHLRMIGPAAHPA